MNQGEPVVQASGADLAALQVPGSQAATSLATLGQRLAAALAEACDASTDEEAVKGWLAARASSPQTHRAYDREAKRLLAWLAWRRGFERELLPLITLPEASDFVQWLVRPAGALIPQDVLAQLGMSGRQPVKEGLGSSSLIQAVSILSSLYEHLGAVRAPWGQYAPFNPFRVLKRSVARGVSQGPEETPLPRLSTRRAPNKLRSPQGKALSTTLWNEALQTVELLPRETARQIDLYWQTWWILRLQYHSVFRRFETAKAKMADVARTVASYELDVVGKGNKASAILMSDVFVRDLKAYRMALGLSPTPSALETGPLVVHTCRNKRAAGAHISEVTVYRRVVGIFERTADRLQQLGATDEDVQPLRDANVHGIRHTGITHLLDKGVSMRTTSRHARHSSIATTAIYDSQDKHLQITELNSGAAKLDAERALMSGRDGESPPD
jgi:integrase/recombinase XerD